MSGTPSTTRDPDGTSPYTREVWSPDFGPRPHTLQDQRDPEVPSHVGSGETPRGKTMEHRAPTQGGRDRTHRDRGEERNGPGVGFSPTREGFGESIAYTRTTRTQYPRRKIGRPDTVDLHREHLPDSRLSGVSTRTTPDASRHEGPDPKTPRLSRGGHGRGVPSSSVTTRAGTGGWGVPTAQGDSPRVGPKPGASSRGTSRGSSRGGSPDSERQVDGVHPGPASATRPLGPDRRAPEGCGSRTSGAGTDRDG